jgi:hypothetical protein
MLMLTHIGAGKMKMRNTITLSIILAFFSLMPATGTAALVGWWKLDDNAANANVADSSGNGRTGILYNNTTALTTQNTSVAHSDDRPEGSGSFVFNGTTNHIRVPGFKGIGGSNPRTCAAWVKTPPLRKVPSCLGINSGRERCVLDVPCRIGRQAWCRCLGRQY